MAASGFDLCTIAKGPGVTAQRGDGWRERGDGKTGWTEDGRGCGTERSAAVRAAAVLLAVKQSSGVILL